MVQDKAVSPAVQSGYRLHKTVVLVGMMGSGKSAIGRSFAARVDVPFRDSDAEIELASQQTIAEIFERDGEAFFRQREREVIKRLLHESPGVLSTGGGAYLAVENREAIAQDAVAVWLDASIDLLWERVRHKDTRPLLRTTDPRGTLEAIFEERTPIYAKAQLALPIKPSASIDETTEALLDLLLQHSDILETSLD